MEAANLANRSFGNNNGYRLLPLSSNLSGVQCTDDYESPRSSYRLDHRQNDNANLFSDSSSEADSVSTHESEHCSVEDEHHFEEWQKKVDANGEIFFVETYSEDAASQSVYNSSSSSGRMNTVHTNREFKLNEAGLLSTLKWLPKQQSLKKNSEKKINDGTTGKADNAVAEAKDENFTRIVKDVVISLPGKRPNLGRGVPLMEGILGVVVKRAYKKDANSVDSIVISNIACDSPASGVPDIKVGDIISSINDVETNLTNFDQLSSIALSPTCKQVKLSLCRFVPVTPKEDKTNKCTLKTSAVLLPKLLSNQHEYWSEINSQMTSVPHLVLYLSLANCDASDKKEDVIYQFPKCLNKLIDIRGTFVTLVQLIPDVVGSQILTSSVWTGSTLMHVAYAQDNCEKLLLVALPGDCVSLLEIREITDNIVSTLKFEYGSLDQAFSVAEHQTHLDLMFSLIYASNVSDENHLQQLSVKRFRSGFGSWLPQQLSLSPDLQICVDSVINEFESSDFADMSEEHYDIRRLYSIVGVSLFFKGYLVSNHLPKSHLQDIFLYLLHCGILDTSRQHLTNIIVWKEIYLSDRSCSDNDRRCFLFVIGKHHFLLAVILETGGCAARAIGPQSPDPFYVERAQATLLQLQLHQITASLNSAIDNTAITCMAQLKKGHTISYGCSDKKSDNTGNKQFPLGRSADWHSLDVIADTDSDSTSILSTAASGTSDDTAPILGRRIQYQAENDVDSIDENQNRHTNSHRQRQLPSFLDLSTIVDVIPVSTSERNTPPARLLSGAQNALISYLQISCGQGVVICPIVKDTDAFEQIWPLKEILQNFEHGCRLINRILNDEEEPMVEHGMMFRASKPSGNDAHKSSDTISYWIVGRMFKDSVQREVYVCHQDTCPQSLVEIAFRLGFGMIM
ncbi:hypothetical protein CHUAL_013760 [Chamberlinius hualienensis]